MTKEKILATDVSKLSYTDLIKHREALEKQIEEAAALIQNKRSEELKVLADGYVKKAEAAGFSAAEAIEALQPYWPKAHGGRKAKAAKDDGEPRVKVVNYRDPANPENTWSGRGRAAKWLAAYEEQGRSREEFKV